MNNTAAESELSWAPDECRLPHVARPLRESEFDDLLRSAVEGVTSTPGVAAVFSLKPEPAVAAQVAELAMRETSCCSFFTFTLTATAGRLSLHVKVPPLQQGLLDAMVARVGASR